MTTARGLTFTTAVRVVHRVHRRAAGLRPAGRLDDFALLGRLPERRDPPAPFAFLAGFARRDAFRLAMWSPFRTLTVWR